MSKELSIQEKELYRQQKTENLKKLVEKEAWISLLQYFKGSGYGGEAKTACVALGILAREKRNKISERRLIGREIVVD